jgi:Fe-S cluster assembly ATPase SufC
MLRNITVRNFKQFEDITVELEDVVVFVGPNDSGKTTALQALALWELGLRRCRDRWGMMPADEMRRPGVSINRLDLFSVPISHANLLWRGLRTREANRQNGGTSNIRIEVTVTGISKAGKEWTCGLEFDYANSESFYCRPLRSESADGIETRIPIPAEAFEEQVAFLPPMSGLSSSEAMLQPGTVNVLLGQGRTAEVLRNLCFQVFVQHRRAWEQVLVPQMLRLFGATILDPQYNAERGEISLRYKDGHIANLELDLSSSGRGFQQTLLLTAYMLLHPNSVIMLDEPDAHLEILRQRQIYRAITETAARQRSQLLIATHSEVILNEAGDRHTVTAFVGSPHRITGRGAQVLKSLAEIGFESYLQAAQAGWVLYLEGSTDLTVLQAFARRLRHPADDVLERPFVHYVGNQPMQARHHFYGLREAYPGLQGFALFDRLNLPDSGSPVLKEHSWRKREIENYLCSRESLLRWVNAEFPLFRSGMEEAISEVENARQVLGQSSPWDDDTKVSEEFLAPLFQAFGGKTGMSGSLSKSDYHFLVEHVDVEEIDPEVISVLDDIVSVAGRSVPVS